MAVDGVAILERWRSTARKFVCARLFVLSCACEAGGTFPVVKHILYSTREKIGEKIMGSDAGCSHVVELCVSGVVVNACSPI